MADVFLSYARPDAAAAERVARELGTCGWSVWYDRELPAHRSYSEIISTELESAAAVLVLWSRASAASQWVRSEANRARELGKLVQARTGEVRLPMPFDQIQCADLTKWRSGRNNEGWSKVIQSVETLSVKSGLPLERSPRRIIEVDRRKLILGAGVGIAIAASGGAWWYHERVDDGSSPESRTLLQKGLDALQSDNPDQRSQAIPLLRQATNISPRYAAAWGALAMAYASQNYVVTAPERLGVTARARAAAARALALEPHEPRALGALLTLENVYKNWFNAERDSRAALVHHPDHPLLLDELASVLMDVGRWTAALPYLSRIDRVHYLLPGADRHLIIASWSSGDLPAADQALEQAMQRWPTQVSVWNTQLLFLMHTGRASEALASLDGPTRPPQLTAQFVAAARSTANALLAKQGIAEAIEQNLKLLRSAPETSLLVAQRCAALGASDVVFPLLDGYYFATGPWAALSPSGGDFDRTTAPLFEPPMEPVRNEPRFTQLLARTGLEAYWRQSRTTPDFRNTAAGERARTAE